MWSNQATKIAPMVMTERLESCSYLKYEKVNRQKVDNDQSPDGHKWKQRHPYEDDLIMRGRIKYLVI